MAKRPRVQPRAAAVLALCRVIGGRESLPNALATELGQVESTEQALVKELCYGTLRWHHRLRAVRDLLLDKPLKRKDLDLACLLEVGLYQLMHMRTPTHASVHGTVQTVAALNKPWAAGVINAVLRNFQRKRTDLLVSVDRRPEHCWSHPLWLFERIKETYPDDWQRICEAANRHPPMTLRVNRSATTVTAYLTQLQAADLEAVAHPEAATAITLRRPVGVDRLPGFAAGMVSVQDAAAQLAAPLLDCRPGMRVLDACAAPGSKAAHLLESVAGDIDLTMVEIDPERGERLKGALIRGGWQAQLCIADAENPAHWWDGLRFDRILLDAPCSGTGVIRRHPDIKLLRTPGDIAAFQARQLRLLRALWPLLVPGGMLLYATCSLLPEEGAQVVERFISEHGPRLLYQRQVLPGDADMDGFYYACLSSSA